MSNKLDRPREIITRYNGRTGKTCPPGSNYCWVCGHVTLPEEFRKHNCCPNPACPEPRDWNND